MRRLLILFLALIAGCARHTRAGELETSYWFWNTPYALTSEMTAELKALGVRQLFVRAGTFRNDGERLIPSVPQKFEVSAFPIHLVYNFDPGALAHLGEFRPADMAQAIVDQLAMDRKACEAAKIEVRGLQLDIDCPTRRLPLYAKLLGEVRSRLPSGLKFSITALPTWLTSSDLGAVVEKVDFYVPQFYEGSVAQTVGDKTPISDLEGMKKGIERAERLGRPYYVGVPAYGRALMYDEKGQLLGGYRSLSAYDAARHPAFELAETDRIGGEAYYRFTAIRPGQDGRGKGYSLVYRLPTPTLTAQHLQEVAREKPPNCLGSILFRVPEEGESMAVGLRSLWAALEGLSLEPKLVVKAQQVAEPWDRIENPGGKGENHRVWIAFENTGAGGTQLGLDAFSVRLDFEPGAVTGFQKGGFDAATPSRALADGSEMKSSLTSANRIVVRRVHLGPGEKVLLGPLTLSRPGAINCSYDLVADATGEHIRGTQRIRVNERD